MHAYSSTTHNSQSVEQPECQEEINRQREKIYILVIHNGILFSHEKE
jgi:hypothetical protein